MQRLLPTLLTALVTATGCWSQEIAADLILVEGGSFRHPGSRYFGQPVTVPDFYLGRCEVTQAEWFEVMGTNPAEFKGDNLPVEMVSWYDCIEYCNRRSVREGLQPCYLIDRTNPDPDNRNENDDVKWTVTVDAEANGYRLPTELEWEYAASGGQLSRSLTYCGSNDLGAVGWFWQNSGDEPLAGLWNWPALEQNHNRTRPVGGRQPNELGLHDMSGNVREWCWDWYEDMEVEGLPRGYVRVWKGGGWMGGDFCCEPSFRGNFEPNSRGYDQGLRVCRTK